MKKLKTILVLFICVICFNSMNAQIKISKPMNGKILVHEKLESKYSIEDIKTIQKYSMKELNKLHTIDINSLDEKLYVANVTVCNKSGSMCATGKLKNTTCAKLRNDIKNGKKPFGNGNMTECKDTANGVDVVIELPLKMDNRNNNLKN